MLVGVVMALIFAFHSQPPVNASPETVVVVPAGLTYLAITATMAVTEASAIVGRARRLLPG